jgi:hypothetical protein
MVQGSNTHGGKIFHSFQNQPWGPTSPLYIGYQVIPMGKAAEALTTHPLSSAEVKERVELNLYTPSGPLWPVLG